MQLIMTISCIFQSPENRKFIFYCTQAHNFSNLKAHDCSISDKLAGE